MAARKWSTKNILLEVVPCIRKWAKRTGRNDLRTKRPVVDFRLGEMGLRGHRLHLPEVVQCIWNGAKRTGRSDLRSTRQMVDFCRGDTGLWGGQLHRQSGQL